MTPTDVVQAQLEAYNRRDIDAFCQWFADDAQVFELGAASPSCSGIGSVRARYQDLFASSPQLRSVVVNRTAFGRAVIDQERITGRNGAAEPFDILVIYEVIGGRIARLHFVRP